MEGSYCTFRFGVIIRRDLRPFSYCLNHCAIFIMRVWCSPRRKDNSCSLGRLSYKKIQTLTIALLHVTPRWLLQEIPPLNFLEPIFIAVLEALAWCTTHWLVRIIIRFIENGAFCFTPTPNHSSDSLYVSKCLEMLHESFDVYVRECSTQMVKCNVQVNEYNSNILLV